MFGKKASVQGPNRRRNRVGDNSILSNFTTFATVPANHDANTRTHSFLTSSQTSGNSSYSMPDCNPSQLHPEQTTFEFRVQSLEAFLHESPTLQSTYFHDNMSLREEALGDGCIFTYSQDPSSDPHSISSTGKKLIQRHYSMVQAPKKQSRKDPPPEGPNTLWNPHSEPVSLLQDPILIHFHDIPVFITRALPILKLDSDHDCDILYVSKVHCTNHKICEDTKYRVTCCSRPIAPSPTVSVVHDSSDSAIVDNYPFLSAVEMEISPRFSDSNSITHTTNPNILHAKDIERKIRKLLCFGSVVTVHELLTLQVMGKDLIGRVTRVAIEEASSSSSSRDDDKEVLSSVQATMDEPYRGRIHAIKTDFYIHSSMSKSHDPSHPIPNAATDSSSSHIPFTSSNLIIVGERWLPMGSLPKDVIHVSTQDGEWFPVRRLLLTPCLKLTKYVQAGRGIYHRDNANYQDEVVSDKNLSPDAPRNDGRIHCYVAIDSSTFDRVLLFILSQFYPTEYQFSLSLSECHAMSRAADILGLGALADVCQSQVSNFESRVRKDEYIPFSEIVHRNSQGELLLLLDGMVLDITRWINEHPGGPSIIPSQALNMDATVFFEMYHVSRQAFLYLKSFYIGELDPKDHDQLLDIHRNKGICPSDGFLQALRSYTDAFRIYPRVIQEKVHKSF